jgi:hypothetical protein
MLSISSAYIAKPASVNTHSAIANVSTFNIMCGSVWDVIKLVTEKCVAAQLTCEIFVRGRVNYSRGFKHDSVA